MPPAPTPPPLTLQLCLDLPSSRSIFPQSGRLQKVIYMQPVVIWPCIHINICIFVIADTIFPAQQKDMQHVVICIYICTYMFICVIVDTILSAQQKNFSPARKIHDNGNTLSRKNTMVCHSNVLSIDEFEQDSSRTELM